MTNHNKPSTSHVTQTTSPDQGLANQLLLTAKDLPAGWQAGDNSGGTSQHDLAVQDQINKTFNHCMSITADQGNVALGRTGPGSDRPGCLPAVARPNGVIARRRRSNHHARGQPGQPSTLELQTDANIVKTHADEQRDFALFTSPKFPQCNAAAVAAALQLGLNDATGGNATPGPATAKVVDLVAPRGEQVMGVTMQFTISDGIDPDSGRGRPAGGRHRPDRGTAPGVGHRDDLPVRCPLGGDLDVRTASGIPGTGHHRLRPWTPAVRPTIWGFARPQIAPAHTYPSTWASMNGYLSGYSSVRSPSGDGQRWRSEQGRTWSNRVGTTGGRSGPRG